MGVELGKLLDWSMHLDGAESQRGSVVAQTKNGTLPQSKHDIKRAVSGEL